MKDNNAPLSSQNRWNDDKVELYVGALLRVGVIISAVIVAIGGIPYLIANGTHPVHFGTFHGQPESVTTVRGILRSAFSLQNTAIIQLGALFLIATPVARVALSLIAFAKQGDRTYVAITALVLGILLWSMSGGSGT